MTATVAASRGTRYGAHANRPHVPTVHHHVAARLGPKCTAKAVEHRLAGAVLLLEVLIEEAYRTGLTAQVEKLFAKLNAHRHMFAAESGNALRRYVVANSTELVERSAWQEAQDTLERRREIDALAEEIACAEVFMVQLEATC